MPTMRPPHNVAIRLNVRGQARTSSACASIRLEIVMRNLARKQNCIKLIELLEATMIAHTVSLPLCSRVQFSSLVATTIAH